MGQSIYIITLSFSLRAGTSDNLHYMIFHSNCLHSQRLYSYHRGCTFTEVVYKGCTVINIIMGDQQGRTIINIITLSFWLRTGTSDNLRYVLFHGYQYSSCFVKTKFFGYWAVIKNNGFFPELVNLGWFLTTPHMSWRMTFLHKSCLYTSHDLTHDLRHNLHLIE